MFRMITKYRLIRNLKLSITQHEIESARKTLIMLDPALEKINNLIPPFEWRSKTKGFAGMSRLIIEQQVSVASANAIWKKFQEGLSTVNVKEVLARDIDELKIFGLSRPKACYIRELAESHANGTINLEELNTLNDDEATAKLITLKGIGRWTAEAYLMSCEDRTDVFPAADIALQEAVRILDYAEKRPITKELYERSQKWRPYRSIAAHLLWSYYTGIKKNQILMPPGVPHLVKSEMKKSTPKLTKNS